MLNSAVKSVPGLRYIPNYLSTHEQEDLMEIIDQQPWLADLKRRVQQYGYRYDYKGRRVDPDLYLGPLPEWLLPLAARVHRDELIETLPDQVIINEYLPGQGIAAHIDCRTCFGESILSLSLGSPCVMAFTRPQDRREVPLLLAPGSLLAMHGESRREWKHGIRARKVDHFDGHDFPRGRRLSLTFRDVVA